MNAIGKANMAHDAVARIGRLTYTTCLSSHLIKAYCGDLHASHTYPPKAVPVTTYRSNPAHARSQRRSVDCRSSLDLLGQLVRSLIFLDREAGRRYRVLTSPKKEPEDIGIWHCVCLPPINVKLRADPGYSP